MEFDHFSLRLLRLSDAEAYFQLVEKNRSRLEDFFTGTTSQTKTFEDTQLFISRMLKRVENKSYFPYLLIENNSQTIIGFFDLKNVDWSIPKSELGCYIDKEYAGKGITTRAFRLFCEFCFQEYGFKKLFLRTHVSNLSARTVAEKCGFEIEGTLRREYKTTKGELVDLIYYGKLN